MKYQSRRKIIPAEENEGKNEAQSAKKSQLKMTESTINNSKLKNSEQSYESCSCKNCRKLVMGNNLDNGLCASCARR